jgi:acetoacetate decarboxylase
MPNIGCRVAHRPVRRIVGARHMSVDFTPPFGEGLHDHHA